MTRRAALCAAVLALGACGGERVTQIVVIIDTDLSVPSRLDEILIEVEGPSTERNTQSVPLGDGPDDLPLTFGLVPASSALGPVTVTVTGKSVGSEVVTRTVRTRFVERESRVLWIRLLRGCVGIVCAEGESCDDATCRDVMVEPAELPVFDGAVHTPELCNARDDDGDGLVDEEFDVQSDPRNCGACGAECTAGRPCQAGRCIDSPIVEVAAGLAHTCARRESGGVTCWGENYFGELGDGTYLSSLTPGSVLGLADASSLSAGSGYTCVVRSGGNVACWGSGQGGELGSGAYEDRPLPTPTVGLFDAAQVTTGWYHACARRTGGGVRCWGHDFFGELGDGTTAAMVPGPVDVLELSDAEEVRVGYQHTCARRSNGAVACWGDGGRGQLGSGTTSTLVRPTAVTGLADAVEVETGDRYTCARTARATLECWGANDDGELGVPTASMPESSTPVAVAGVPEELVQLSASCPIDPDSSFAPEGYGSYTCALGRSGLAYCWGRNGAGQLGDGTTTSRATLARVSTLSGIRQVTAGAGHACALLESPREVWCWGDNSSGQLGDGTTISSPTPVRVQGL